VSKISLVVSQRVYSGLCRLSSLLKHDIPLLLSKYDMLRHVVVIRQCDISSSVLKYDVVFLWAGEKCDLLSCGLAKGIVSFFGVIIFLFTLVIQNRDILSSP
jgi:hypothetical protein